VAEKGFLFVVASLTANYKAPARLDDHLQVRTSLLKMGASSMELEQDIYRDDALITELKVTLVCIDRGFKAVRLPEEIRKLFEARL
jgi:acyl-CoA thioester hydrolase